jgi:hypothetical protein
MAYAPLSWGFADSPALDTFTPATVQQLLQAEMAAGSAAASSSANASLGAIDTMFLQVGKQQQQQRHIRVSAPLLDFVAMPCVSEGCVLSSQSCQARPIKVGTGNE